MPLQSDVMINAFKFDPRAVSEKSARLNEDLLKIDRSDPYWWDVSIIYLPFKTFNGPNSTSASTNNSQVGATKFRQMRQNGETAFPKPTILPEGRDISIASRDPNRSIKCRLFNPASSKPNGVILHIHGGGWVLMSESSFDPLLKFYADVSGCAVVSVGYRLAPEYPFPAGPEDCFDVAEYLVRNGEKEYGEGLKFMAGEVRYIFYHTFLSCPYHLLSNWERSLFQS